MYIELGFNVFCFAGFGAYMFNYLNIHEWYWFKWGL